MRFCKEKSEPGERHAKLDRRFARIHGRQWLGPIVDLSRLRRGRARVAPQSSEGNFPSLKGIDDRERNEDERCEASPAKRQGR
jgi:hypothetical protein